MAIRGISLMLAVMLVFAGCSQEAEEEPTAVKAPPPPTQSVIVNEISGHINPIMGAANTGAPLRKKVRSDAINGLKQSRSKYGGTPNGSAAFDQVAGRLRDEIKRSQENRMWEYVVFACDAHDVLKPDRKRDVARIREKALVQMRRPRAKVKSFMTVDYETNDRVAFIEVTIPTSGETEKGSARIGDTIMGLRIVDFVGNNEGVRFEYVETGEVFEVFMSR